MSKNIENILTNRPVAWKYGAQGPRRQGRGRHFVNIAALLRPGRPTRHLGSQSARAECRACRKEEEKKCISQEKPI